MVVHVPFCDASDATLGWKEKLVPRMFVVSGKGGVGKTTMAAALAISRVNEGKRVLVASIDPAHSLGDSLNVDLSSGAPRQVDNHGRLEAMEVRVSPDAWPAVPGEDETPARLLGSAFFPVSEEMAVISGLVNTFKYMLSIPERFDEIIIDAAPSGHMLRALSFPFQMNEHVMKIGAMYQKIKSLFTLDGDKRQFMKHHASLLQSFTTIITILQNPGLSTMLLVTIPETMAVLETARTRAELARLQVPVGNLIINKIHDPAGITNLSCQFCAARRIKEHEVLLSLHGMFPDLVTTAIPLLDTEVRGLEGLARVARMLR